MKSLAIMIIATVALLSATAVVHAEPSSACASAGEATEASEVACAAGEQEAVEEAEELEYEEEVAAEEIRSDLAASSIRSEPVSSTASTPSPAPPTTPKLSSCRRASEATIRTEAKYVRELRGKRRRAAERRLDRALCRPPD